MRHNENELKRAKTPLGVVDGLMILGEFRTWDGHMNKKYITYCEYVWMLLYRGISNHDCNSVLMIFGEVKYIYISGI